MDSSYQNYLSQFKRFAPEAVADTGFKGLSDYSTFINNKANEIISNASRDRSIDSLVLQQEIFALGVDFVKNFASMSKPDKSDPS